MVDRLHAAVRKYAKQNAYTIDRLEPMRCGGCARGGRTTFAVELAGEDAARVRCAGCRKRTYVDDSREFWADNLADGELGECQCPCGHETFRVVVGRACYAGSRDTKWLYLGMQCTRCKLAAVYADWGVR